MATHELTLSQPRPYFAEVPYYLWGEVNYDSEGDCKKPTDRNWTWLRLERRDTGETVEISGNREQWEIDGPDPAAARGALFLAERCGASVRAETARAVADWNHAVALSRAARVAREFEQPDLAPFDTRLFWGSWKWIGWFATEFTWVGRWIMHSVVRKDPRAVSLCIDWLKQGTVSEVQSAALRHALSVLTGARFDSDEAWLRWYHGGLLAQGQKAQYPEPNFDSWLADLKAQQNASAGG
jgi:hypothetical protein